jgi:hypothetical protein
LSIDNLLALITLLLIESKVVFVCTSNNMITEVMEALKGLLFPLKWSTTFISRLPMALSGLFQALGMRFYVYSFDAYLHVYRLCLYILTYLHACICKILLYVRTGGFMIGLNETELSDAGVEQFANLSMDMRAEAIAGNKVRYMHV